MAGKKKRPAPTKYPSLPAITRKVPIPYPSVAQEDKPHRNTQTRQLNSTVSRVIREIGEEQIEGSGRDWTRLEALVRSLYADALSGKTAAAELLLERGWGKVPTPIEINVEQQIQKMVLEVGLTLEDVQNDPVIAEIVASSGVDLARLPGLIEAPETVENE